MGILMLVGFSGFQFRRRKNFSNASPIRYMRFAQNDSA
jgi:hypothetical protein